MLQLMGLELFSLTRCLMEQRNLLRLLHAHSQLPKGTTSQIEKEGLTYVYGVKKFHAYLFGHPFVLYTDHKPLMHLFGVERTVPSQESARIQKWALTLAMYEYTMAFKQATANGNIESSPSPRATQGYSFAT